MDMEESTLWILVISIIFICILILLILGLIVLKKIINYFNKKYELDYKVYLTSTGIKNYVDTTLDEYITDALEEIVTTDPEYIGKHVINPAAEKDLLTKVVHQVIIFMPESFKEQMRKVYNIDIIVDSGTTGLIDIVTRKAYVKILTLAVAANSVKKDTMNIQDIMFLNENSQGGQKL